MLTFLSPAFWYVLISETESVTLQPYTLPGIPKALKYLTEYRKRDRLHLPIKDDGLLIYCHICFR